MQLHKLAVALILGVATVVSTQASVLSQNSKIKLPKTQDNLNMNQTNAKEIAALLNRAGQAHHEYEQTVLKGVYDRDWATWYAEYAIADGLNNLLDSQLTPAQLGLFLDRCNEKYNQEKSEQNWASYTAQKIAQELHVV